MTGAVTKRETVTKRALAACLIIGCLNCLGAASSHSTSKQPDAYAREQTQGTVEAVPEFFRERSFTATTLADAANHFVGIGEEAAIKELQKLATPKNEALHRAFSMRQRIGWVCRVLFAPKGQEPLREPMFGVLP